MSYPQYRVNGRGFATYEEANYYWKARGGVLMEKLDHLTPWHVLQTKGEKMRPNAVGDIRIVGNLGADFILETNSQDVEVTKVHLGEIAKEYDAFFLKVENGEYKEVWGMVGKTPYLSKLVRRLL